MFKRILIANRGEIALRIIRACRELGVETVAIFSEADRGAAYLQLADEAYCVGPPKAADSYLKIDRVISAAEIGNVQAIHPGYGFLAENAHFAEICRSCNIEFIGPSHEAMTMLGDKNNARRIARDAGVPTVAGSEGLIRDEAEAIHLARQIGFPVLIKASAGGGGRGMRVAMNDLALKSALQQARAEAEAAFGNGDIYMEKYVEHPRHVEVQVLADLHGNAVHLWERDCTMQRRHQKLIEESPAPTLPAATRTAICEAAVRLVKCANYTNAGTCEFIVDRQGNFFFIELNARIQVEHPVTEMITGIDLIKSQIRIASGEPLPFCARGHPLGGGGPRMPDQCRRSDQELSPHAGQNHPNLRARRIRGPLRFPRPRRLQRVALLRFDDRQADRPPAYPRGSHRGHEAGPGRTPHRGSEDHRRTPPGDSQPLRIHRGLGRHDLHRAHLAPLSRTAAEVRKRGTEGSVAGTGRPVVQRLRASTHTLA